MTNKFPTPSLRGWAVFASVYVAAAAWLYVNGRGSEWYTVAVSVVATSVLSFGTIFICLSGVLAVADRIIHPPVAPIAEAKLTPTPPQPLPRAKPTAKTTPTQRKPKQKPKAKARKNH